MTRLPFGELIRLHLDSPALLPAFESDRWSRLGRDDVTGPPAPLSMQAVQLVRAPPVSAAAPKPGPNSGPPMPPAPHLALPCPTVPPTYLAAGGPRAYCPGRLAGASSTLSPAILHPSWAHQPPCACAQGSTLLHGHSLSPSLLLLLWICALSFQAAAAVLPARLCFHPSAAPAEPAPRYLAGSPADIPRLPHIDTVSTSSLFFPHNPMKQSAEGPLPGHLPSELCQLLYVPLHSTPPARVLLPR